MRELLSKGILHLVGNRSAKGLKISHQLKYYNVLKKSQWNGLETNIETQKQLLFELLQYAIECVPYYRDLGFCKTDFRRDSIFEDIKKIPILTKDIIRKEGNRMYPDVKLNDWIYNSISGGTTGEPVSFRHSGYFNDVEQAGKLLFDDWAGRSIGESQIRLWGSERDIVSGKKDWMNKIYRFLRNENFINTFRLDNNRIEEIIGIINKEKPKMILCYVQSITEIAKYVIDHDLNVYSPNAIMTSAGTLTPDIIKLIKKAFHCKVLNRYGSREMGDMACSCGESEQLHINLFTCYLEVVDEQGFSVANEIEGEVLTTLLTDYSMPIIRYAIGDRGALSNDVCQCGRGLPMLKNITGRIIDFFINENGEKVYGDYFTHLFYPCINVKQFQVIQDKINEIKVKLVFISKEEGLKDQEFYQYYEKNIKSVMGEKTNVVFEVEDDIPLSSSGKRIYTICNIKE